MKWIYRLYLNRVIPIIVVCILLTSSINTIYANNNQIPSWLKQNAIFWYNGQISDSEYIAGLEYLINEKIIKIKDKAISKSTTIDDNGDFYITYHHNDNSLYEAELSYLQGTEALESQIDILNSFLRLPYDIEVVVQECGVINAFYIPSEKQIVMCYEIIDDIFDLFYYFHHDDKSQRGIDYMGRYAATIILGIFYHEVGHALIDVYDLPITGLEENVADQFIIFIFSHAIDSETQVGYEVIINNGYYYELSKKWKNEVMPDYVNKYYTVHGVDEQRKFNMYCWAYGYDPTYSNYMIEKGHLPKERAISCSEEHNQIMRAWVILLYDYVQ